MDVITNGCNGSLSHSIGEDERTQKTKNVILSTLPHSPNDNENNNDTPNGCGDADSIKSITPIKPKRTQKCVALLDDNRYAIRIEDMVEEHLKFGRLVLRRSVGYTYMDAGSVESVCT